ncbi:hypothetical protein [Acinetobacter baumannii]|uniref:hypothetical protein n=1 Tax=Acinetobacter baumannii TaxID=470 RepID=UPI00057D61AE|nr:hypothetical protein [Acinetobacter baumannii]KHX93134.1 hypothetical protein RQ53_04275 [Acinetobacter baumannii]
MKKIFLAALATIGLQACTTPYQEMGASGGVEATIIDDNVFQVRASVNGLMCAEKTGGFNLVN